jgi:hypothetical protein
MEKWVADTGAGTSEPIPRRSPIDYATGERSGRPHAKLSLFFGPNYRQTLRGVAGDANLQRAALWPRLVGVVWPAADEAVYDTLAGVLTTPGALEARIASVVLATKAAPDAVDVPRVAALVQQLAGGYAAGGEITADVCRELMGKPIAVEELLQRVILGLDMMADEVQWSPGLFDKLLEVGAIESFLPMVIKKAGHEHGYTFELRVAARELFGDGATEVDPARLWLQLVVGGKAGPDLGVVVAEEGIQRVRLIQAKSYRDLGALLRASDSGEIWRQLSSDLRRLQETGFRVTNGTAELEISQTISFKIDWYRLRRDSFQMVPFSPEELHLARESSDAVKDEFRRRYVDDSVKKLQELLDASPYRHPNGQPFKLEVEIVDQTFPDVVDETVPGG